jgi:cation diffusion facilitator CzcD-associated flavoprotein CzcO
MGESESAGQPSVVIIGAGFAGIASAIRLRQAGVHDFVILERASRVGGTWRDAVYPGAEVDVPSFLYCLSFAPNPNWTSMNCAAPEIQAYIEDVVERFGIADHIRFGANVVQAEFDEPAGRWHVSTEDGRTFSARAVIAADGLLANAEMPRIPGVETFTGQKILSAAWVRDYDVRDKRVAVVGTGASAVQIIPEMVKIARHVTVFQRTAAWCIPRANFKIPGLVKKLFQRFPQLQQAIRLALFVFYEILTYALVWITPLTKVVETVAKAHLRSQVKDPVLRKKLTPDYRIGCKRPLITSEFYPALQKPHVTFVPEGVVELTENTIRAADGSEHEVDCVVFATGYDVARRGSAFKVIGLDGRVLGDEWAGGKMIGYKSVHVSGFPNLSWTMGPNAFGHSSELLFIEEQVRYAVMSVKKILDADLAVLDVKPEAQVAYNEQLQRKLAKTTFNSGCHSWFLTETGFNGRMFPGGVLDFRRQLSLFDSRDYTAIKAVPEAVPAETRTGIA